MINPSVNQGSAKIYQFPVGGRAGLGGRRFDTRTALEIAAAEVNQADCSGSWYHAAAIEEARPDRDH